MFDLRQLDISGRVASFRHLHSAAFFFCLAAALAPLVAAAVPPLLDYPAHLARVFIIRDLLTGGTFSTMYHLHFAVIPNLGIDAVILPMVLIGVPVELAGRIFLALIIFALGLGVSSLHRALFGRTSLFPLLALGYIYNPVFMYGFVNYLLGLALALLGFSWWIRSRNLHSAQIVPRLLIVSVALFFCHLTAVLLLFGLIASYETSLALAPSRHAVDGRPAALFRAAALLLLPMLTVIGLYRLGPFGVSGNLSLITEIGKVIQTFPERLRQTSLYVHGYSDFTDYVSVGLLAITVLTASYFRWLRIAWPMALPILGLTGLYLIIPDAWAGTEYIAYRVPIAILFLGLASIDLQSELPIARLAAGVAITFIVLAKSTVATMAWVEADRTYAPMLAALDQLPPGATLYTGVNYRDSFEPELRLPWSHFTSYGVIRRRLFAADLWADPTQNWIIRTPRYESLSELAPLNNRVDRNPRPAPWHDMFAPALLAKFDYLLAVQPELYQRNLPGDIYPIVRSGKAVLFKIGTGAN